MDSQRILSLFHLVTSAERSEERAGAAVSSLKFKDREREQNVIWVRKK